ncbi:MAG: molybdopterin-binding protein [Bacteroidales bacterium]
MVTYVKDAMAAAGWQYEIERASCPMMPWRSGLPWREEPAWPTCIPCGGTGIGPRDITPDVVRPMLTKEIRNRNKIRVKYGMMNPKALLSRAVAGTIGNNLVYTLPGSVEQCMSIWRDC